MNIKILFLAFLVSGLAAIFLYRDKANNFIEHLNIKSFFSDITAGKNQTGDYQKNYLKEVEELALQITPEREDEFIDTGVKASRAGNNKEALLYYDAVIKANPKNIRVWTNRSAVKMGSGDYRGAVEDNTVSLMLDPSRSLAYYNRSLAYYNLKEYENAIRDINAYIESGKFITRWGHNNEGRAYLLQGDIFYSLQCYEEALTSYIYAQNKMPAQELEKFKKDRADTLSFLEQEVYGKQLKF